MLVDPDEPANAVSRPAGRLQQLYALQEDDAVAQHTLELEGTIDAATPGNPRPGVSEHAGNV